MKYEGRTRGWKSMKQRRYELRENQTEAEALLWKFLQKKKLNGIRFRRQHGIGPYVVDFYHAQSKTVIEVDGSIHRDPEIIEADQWRENYLIDREYIIIRFSNEEIYNDIDSVLTKILNRVTQNLSA